MNCESHTDIRRRRVKRHVVGTRSVSILLTPQHEPRFSYCRHCRSTHPPFFSFFPNPSLSGCFIHVATVSAKKKKKKKYNKASLVWRDWRVIKLWIVRFLAEGWCGRGVGDTVPPPPTPTHPPTRQTNRPPGGDYHCQHPLTLMWITVNNVQALARCSVWV